MSCEMHRVMHRVVHYDALCGALGVLYYGYTYYAVLRLEQYRRAGTSEITVEAHLRETDEHVRARSRRDEAEPTGTLVHVYDCTLQAHGCGSTEATETQEARGLCTLLFTLHVLLPY